MRILHIVTYISPDGAFGGPARVALNQAKALNNRGHEVVVAAAAGGFKGALPDIFDGVPVKLHRGYKILPRGGFAGLTSPGMLRWLRTAIAEFDVIHIHLARDLVTLPAGILAKIFGKPFVVQPHGMIANSKNILSKPLDVLMTVSVLKSAARVLYLTNHEKGNLQKLVGSNAGLELASNGVDIQLQKGVEQEQGPVTTPEVVYLARLHPVKRPIFMVNAAQALRAKWPSARFSLVGPDEGEGRKIQKAINDFSLEERVVWEGPVAPEESTERLARASIFALPSESESFGMSVAEAMALGIPVVVTDGCGLASIIREEHAGIVCNQTQRSFTEALERLLREPDLRIQMGSNGRRAIGKHYSMGEVSAQLAGIYESAIKKVGQV